MRVSILMLGLSVITACGGGGSGGPVGPPAARFVTTQLVANQPRFSPANVEVAVGGTVTWQIPAAAPTVHNVTSTTNAWVASPDLSAGQTFVLTFQQAGSFPYLCTNHAGMTGTVTVR